MDVVAEQKVGVGRPPLPLSTQELQHHHSPKVWMYAVDSSSWRDGPTSQSPSPHPLLLGRGKEIGIGCL
jgi:hypothetical protein